MNKPATKRTKASNKTSPRGLAPAGASDAARPDHRDALDNIVASMAETVERLTMVHLMLEHDMGAAERPDPNDTDEGRTVGALMRAAARELLSRRLVAARADLAELNADLRELAGASGMTLVSAIACNTAIRAEREARAVSA